MFDIWDFSSSFLENGLAEGQEMEEEGDSSF